MICAIGFAARLIKKITVITRNITVIKKLSFPFGTYDTTDKFNTTDIWWRVVFAWRNAFIHLFIQWTSGERTLGKTIPFKEQVWRFNAQWNRFFSKARFFKENCIIQLEHASFTLHYRVAGMCKVSRSLHHSSNEKLFFDRHLIFTGITRFVLNKKTERIKRWGR